jgi:SNF2 family DNA or RNA helicase
MLIVENSILEKARGLFNPKFVNDAQNVIEKSQVNISFKKGNSERFFTISGLILSNPKYETRLTYKKDPFKLTSSCNCSTWKENNHCHHATALYLSFLMHESLGDEGRMADSLMMFHQGVHPHRYGEILYGANRLPGAQNNSTYSSLQYTLTNKKIVHFPLPSELKHKVRMELVEASEFDEYQNLHNADKKFKPIFTLINEDGEELKEVSVMEYLYIFNWVTGEAYHQTKEMKDFIRTIKARELDLNFNDYLRLTQSMRANGQMEIFHKGEPLSQKKQSDFKFRFRIDKSKRRNYLKFSIETFDEENRKIFPPEFFSLFVYNNGALNSFRTKNDASEFMDALIESLESNLDLYKKYTHGSDKRNYLAEWIDLIMGTEKIEIYEVSTQTYLTADAKMIRTVISSFFKCFGTNSFRFSMVNHEDMLVTYDLLKSTLFEGVSTFYHFMQTYNLEIFYNDIEVKNWSSSIKFERSHSNLDWFDLNMDISDEDLAIIKNADIHDNFIVSKDKLVLLSAEQKKILKFMKKYTKFEAETSSTGENSKRFKLHFRRARIFELFELKKLGIEGALTEQELQLCDKLLNLEETPDYPLPSKYAPIARHYQSDGYKWLKFLFENRFGACLADDMGLGKTLQTIMFLDSIIDQVEKIIIISPVSILINWENEIKKFSGLDVSVYYGDERDFSKTGKIVLTSYGIMKKEVHTTFADTTFDVLIFDEVQQLKNIRSQGAHAARSISAKFRICLTGTPVENDLSEFYNIMDLAVPGVWGELGFIKSSSSKKTRLLARQTVRPFILRRTKEQVLNELPDKVEQYIYLPFSEDEQENYKNKLINIQENMKNLVPNKKYGEVLKNLLELRQMCLWQKNNRKIASAKVDYLIESMEQIIEENHKVIIFSQFTTYLDLIQKEVKDKKWKFSRIDGSQQMKKRQKEVENFQEGDSMVFLISLKAGGFGLNLTAASYIFLMDPWWNPAVENQAIDRAHRIGQENKLTVYRPIIKDSIEEKVLVLQNNKKELFKDLMADEEKEFFDGKLTMDDFKNLLS